MKAVYALFVVATCTSKGVGLLQHQLQQIYPLEGSCLGWPREALDKGTEHNIFSFREGSFK